MNRRWFDNFLAVCVVILILAGMMLSAGCVSITYDQQAGVEHLEVKTLFKSLDGLMSERDQEGFSILIDKTYTHDPLRAIAELVDIYEELNTMGVRYDPEWRSPIDPNK